MAKRVIYVGVTTNDGKGDTLKVGAQKINDNFTELYTALGADSGSLSVVSGLSAGPGITVSSQAGQVTVTSKVATDTVLGGVIIGDNLNITEDGVLSANAGNYSLPVATGGTLGGVKVTGTDGIAISQTGVISVIPYSLPTATDTVLGGIKVGSRLSITNGVLSATDQSYTLPKATDHSLGGVIVDGTTIAINSNGVISVLAGGGTGTIDRLINGDNKVVLEADGTISLPTLAVANGTGYTSTGPTLALGERTSNVVITQQEYDSDSRGNYNIEIRGQRGYGTWSTTGNGGFGSNIEIYGGQGGETSDDLGAGAQGGEGGYVFIRGGNGQAGEGGGFVELRAGDAQMSVGSSYNVYGGNVNLQAGNANNSIEANKGYGGNVAITAGQGNTVGQHGGVSINTINGNWEFTQDGRLRIANAYSLTAAQNSFINAGSAPTVAYTSLDGAIGGIKATIKVYARQADNIDGDHDEDTQMCEMVISTKRRFIDNGGTWIKTAVASVYGVTHTSTLPLATFTVNYVENYISEPGAQPRDVVQILAEPTAAVTGTDMWVMVTATELTND